MTGTERASLRLALGVLRDRRRDDESALACARAALRAAFLGAISRPLDEAWTGSPWCAPVPCRVLIARLALYLRAVLRAERGDCGPWRCRGCGETVTDHALLTRCYAVTDDGRATLVPVMREIRPLWQAPGVRGAR